MMVCTRLIISRLAILGLLWGCNRVVPAQASAGIQSDIVDYATDFIETACRSITEEDFAKAWLTHEERHWLFYREVHYFSEEASNRRGQLANEMALRRDEVCVWARSFVILAPGAVAQIRQKVENAFAVAPKAPIYFSAALQRTDGRATAFDGRDIIALNASHETFSKATGLAATIAHEFIHDAQLQAQGKADEMLPPVARSLFREGAAVYGVTVLFPELGDRAVGLNSEQLERARHAAPMAAAAILAVLRTTDAEPELKRFFSGNYVGEDFPPKMGYYLGRHVFQMLSEKYGGMSLLHVLPEEFLVEAENELQKLSKK